VHPSYNNSKGIHKTLDPEGSRNAAHACLLASKKHDASNPVSRTSARKLGHIRSMVKSAKESR
jgi:hypothetical protein